MIRYVCPHCQRVCESADVLRGFSVLCLGCRQSIRVPLESILPGDEPATPPPAPPLPPAPPAPDHVAEAPRFAAPAQPLANRLPAAVPLSPAKTLPPSLKTRPIAPISEQSPPQRRLIWILLAGLAAILVIGGGFYGWRWYAKRSAGIAPAEEQQREALQRRIHENFTPEALRKLAAKVPKWESAITAGPRMKGKAVVLSVSGTVDRPVTWWTEITDLANQPALIRDLFERGQVDDLMFELPDERWAEGIGEVDVVIGVRWRKESADGPAGTLRWRATVLVLDLKSGRVIARNEFLGPPPKPDAATKSVAGPRPHEEVRQWLLHLEAGRLP